MKIKSLKICLLSLILVLASCNTTTYNYEEYDYDIETKKIHCTPNKDFQYGVDLSSIIQVEEAGGIFYDKDGKSEDIFKLLNDNGVNSIRMRLWNNPKDKDGNYFGGGNNDLETDLKIAKRAKEYDMSILLDFHYSDWWAGPNYQRLPKDFENSKDIHKDLYNYTKSSLEAFKDNGIDIEYIQIGNEINNGLLYPYGLLNPSQIDSSFERIADLLKSASKACKEVFEDSKIMVHLAGTNRAALFRYLDHMEKHKLDYDIIGISAYPYWIDELEISYTTLNDLTHRYNKDLMIAETSYAFTLENHKFADNVFKEKQAGECKYEVSYRGQIEEITDMVDIVTSINNERGIGVYYWEPAWLPLENAEAGNEYSAKYHGYYAEGKGKCQWANQALFSYTGKMLPSLQTYKSIQKQFL